MNKTLVDFYTKGGKDSQGRRFSEIMSWSNYHLEMVHDYIQWVFPTKTRSQFNPDAPVLDEDTIAELMASPVFHKNFSRAIERINSFWFVGNTGSNGKAEWMEEGDHNLLRMSRFMESCSLLGHGDSALELFERLEYISKQTHGNFISKENLKYWRKSCGQETETM
jgi:hypothetical protein